MQELSRGHLKEGDVLVTLEDPTAVARIDAVLQLARCGSFVHTNDGAFVKEGKAFVVSSSVTATHDVDSETLLQRMLEIYGGRVEGIVVKAAKGADEARIVSNVGEADFLGTALL